MKQYLLIALAGLLAITSAAAHASDYQTLNYSSQGGANWFVGGGLEVQSGGTLTIDSGATVVSAGNLDLNPAFSTAILGNPVEKVVAGSVTLAQLNAGAHVLAATTGRTIYVTNAYVEAVGGSAAACTALVLQDTAGSPVNALTFPVADLTSGAVVAPFSASVTMGAGFGPAGLTAAKGLDIAKTGSSCTTATSFKYVVSYTVQ